MYNLCNAGDHITDFRALIFRMTCCRWKFEFNFFLWNKGKVCCIRVLAMNVILSACQKRDVESDLGDGVWVSALWALSRGALSLLCPCAVF